MGWLSIIGQVAGVVSNVLSQFGTTTTGQSSVFTQGDIEWSIDPNTQEIYAYNASQVENGLSYTINTTESGLQVNRTIFQPLIGDSSYNASKDLVEFKDGDLCVGRVESDEASGSRVIWRLVSYGVSALALGLAVRVIGLINLEVYKKVTPEGTSYGVLFGTTAPPLQIGKVDVFAQDNRGGAVRATADFREIKRTQNGWDVPLPNGVDLDPIVKRLDVTLELPADAYAAITAERRLMTVAGRPR